MANYSELAGELYSQHFNCAQAVLCAFGDRTKLDQGTALRLASSFGGGMGNLKEVCGALTGAFIVLGLLRGYTDPTRDNKRDHAARVDRLADAFWGRFGTIQCRGLLMRNAEEGDVSGCGAKPCLKYVTAAADILNTMLEREGSESTRTARDK